MEKIKPIELVTKLNSWIDPNDTLAGGDVNLSKYMLSEDLWGLERGVYTPIGRLALPVAVEFDTVFDKGNYLITLWSQFVGENLDSTFDLSQKYFGRDDGELKEGVIYYPRLEGIETLVTKGELNETPFDLIMRRHIPEFLRLYDQTKGMPATTESLQNIRKAFVDYRS